MLGTKKNYIIELDGALYFCSGSNVRRIEDLKDVETDAWFISDMSEAVSRVMTVETPAKYSDVMVRKALQEAGEFDEPLHVISHWKKKKGRQLSENFFTALPVRLFSLYQEQINEKEDSVLLFTLYSVLFRLLRRTNPKGPVALVFRHSHFADLIIASSKQVYFANRCTVFEEFVDQVDVLWETIKGDIHVTEAEKRIKVEKVLLLNWLDTDIDAEWPKDIHCELYPLEAEELVFEEETRSCSFLKAASLLFATDAVPGPQEKVFYYSRRAAPYLNAFLIIFVLLFFGGYYWYGTKADQLGEEIKTVEATLAALKDDKPLPKIPYKKTLEFVEELNYYGQVDSFKKTVGDVSEALSRGMSIEILKINHGKDEIRLEALGKVEADFDTAYRGYQTFVDTLRQKGYKVMTGSAFNTEIRQADFLLKIRKKFSR